MFYDVFGPHSFHNDFDRLVDRLTNAWSHGPRAVNQDNPLNVWANADSVAITTEVPGVDPASLQISIVGDTVTLAGQRETGKAEAAKADAAKPETAKAAPEASLWHRRERGGFAFQRTIQLPYRVDADNAEAKVKDGVLTVTLRRVEADKPRAIQVSAA
jgi:HSP20 family protein